MTRKSSTETLIAAMRILARDIESGDSVANAAISEAADRLEELQSHVMSEHLRDATKMAEQQARIAELEAKAAIGRHAVGAVIDALDNLIHDNYERSQCGYRSRQADADLVRAAILRDAEQAAPEPATAAVDAGALEALRSAMSKLRAPMSRTEYAAARAGIIEAAYRLLAGGKQ